MRSLAIFIAPLVLAAALRLPHLASRPMHADEAVNAAKVGALLDDGVYAYDPVEYHGPTLYYLTLLAARLRGVVRYVDLDEVLLRSVPAVLGVALVAAHIGARSFLGTAGAFVAALLAAMSPAMVFYSRYFIHETALVLFTFALLLAGYRYARAPGALSALLAGASAGLMVATKETAVLALGSMLLALAASGTSDRWRGANPRHLLLALLTAFVLSAAFFSSFFARPDGLVDGLRAYGFYYGRSLGSQHAHPWSYYLGLLIHSPSTGTPFWTEGLILVLAVIGGVAGWRAGGAPSADPRMLRFLALYTLLMLTTYSAIPYKTPWCLLGFLHGMILLAGTGAAFLARALRGVAVKAVVGAIVLGAAGHLVWQAVAASFFFAADPRNPYVYAHTGTDVFEIVKRVRDLARSHPDGSGLPIQVISGQNLWPLPWYWRGLSRTSWWSAVPDSAPNAPVIIVTPEMEPALARKLYDLPPPGERELYVRIFGRPLELRPGVEVRGYAANHLWQNYRPE